MSRNLVLDPLPQPSTQPPPPARPRLSPPSERDLQAYKRVKIWRDPQWAVAVEMQLHYSRVSQIVKKVEQWLLAGGSPTDPEIRDHVARRRLSRADHKLRLQRAVELATTAMEIKPEPQTTTRRRTVQGTEVWREETTRDPQPVNLAAVRLLVRATEVLHKLEEQEEHRATEEPLPEHDLLPAVFELLCRWRMRAEADGRLPATSDATALVASALNGLLGTQLGPPVSETVETTAEPLAQEPQRTPSLSPLTVPPDSAASGGAQDALKLSAEPDTAAAASDGEEASYDESLADIAEKIPELECPSWARSRCSSAASERARPRARKTVKKWHRRRPRLTLSLRPPAPTIGHRTQAVSTFASFAPFCSNSFLCSSDFTVCCRSCRRRF